MTLNESDFTNWEKDSEGLPEKETCAQIDEHGKWHMMKCSDEVDVICEKSKCKLLFNIVYILI